MCQLCLLKGKMTVKERLSASTEMLRTAEDKDVNHIADVWNKALKEYADEISKEVTNKQYDQLSFADFIVDWDE